MSPPRVVLDTNVIVSSLYGGLPARIWRLWREERLRVLMSQPIVDEYVRVLQRFPIPAEVSDELVALLGHRDVTEWVQPLVRIHEIVEDPPDNRFLECAVAGQADAIVSGDKHLLRLETFHGVPILTPRAFLQTIA